MAAAWHPGDEVDLLEMLMEIIRDGGGAPQLGPSPQGQRSAQLLMESKRPVILLGSSFLAHPDNVSLLKVVEQLIACKPCGVDHAAGERSTWPAHPDGNTTPLSTRMDLQHLEVLHLIGEAMPADLLARPFVLYQNIYPPASRLRPA